jgi:hypothetical protein
MNVIVVLFVLIAAFCGLAGVASLSQATQGVGFLTAGCLAAIFARLIQAAHQHARSMEAMDAIRLEAVKQTSKAQVG